MGRDRGKGKAGGRGGGGKKMFIANEDELALRNREVSEHQEARNRRRAGSDDEGVAKKGENEGDDDEEVHFVQPLSTWFTLFLMHRRRMLLIVSLHLIGTPRQTQ